MKFVNNLKDFVWHKSNTDWQKRKLYLIYTLLSSMYTWTLSIDEYNQN